MIKTEAAYSSSPSRGLAMINAQVQVESLNLAWCVEQVLQESKLLYARIMSCVPGLAATAGQVYTIDQISIG